jgi:hypothetical protein
MWNFKTLKIQRSFQNSAKILELQKSFTTYKWGIMHMKFNKSCRIQENIKNLKIKFWLWFEIVII